MKQYFQNNKRSVTESMRENVSGDLI